MAELHYQGHGSYRLTANDGTVIYVDPYAGSGYEIPADLILISHEHYDHTAADKCAKKENCDIYRATDMLKNNEYQTIAKNGITVTAVPAYNKNHPVESCVGFIIFIDNLKIYAAGDTSKTDFMYEMANMKLDFAILPCDGIFNMNTVEASECAKIIGAAHSIPVHTKPGALFDLKTAEKFTADGKILITPGETITL